MPVFPARIHIAIGRRKYDIDTRLAAQSEVALQIARIPRKILRRAELRRVYVNTDHDFPPLPTSFRARVTRLKCPACK